MINRSSKRIEVIRFNMDISKVSNKLHRDYREPIKQFMHLNIDDRLKAFNHFWQPENLSIKKKKVGQNEIQYLSAYGSIETKSSSMRYEDLAQMLEVVKKPELWKRLISTQVYFVQEHQEVLYSFIVGSKTTIKFTKSKLFRIFRGKSEIWDDTEINLVEFSSVNNFYIWLSSISGKTITFGQNEQLKVVNILGWDGTDVRGDGAFSGQCSNADNDCTFHSFIMGKKFFEGLTISLMYNKLSLNFELFKDGSIDFDVAKCYKLNGISATPIDEIEVISSLYFRVLPILKSEFNAFMEKEGTIGIKKIEIDIVRKLEQAAKDFK